MNELLVDIGNSRIKWALRRNGRMGRMQALPLEGIARFARALNSMSALDAVRVVNVAGRPVEQMLRKALRAAAHPVPLFIRSSDAAAGVTNGYREAWRLGADRWVAAIGAWHEAGARRAVCAVNVGTALTIDAVTASGRHQGGLIAPGPTLMRQALLGATRGIAVRAAGASRSARSARPLADNTRDAVDLGCLIAAAAMVDRAVAEVRASQGTRPQVYLAGGAADALLPLLQTPVIDCPDLVLRGLAVLA